MNRTKKISSAATPAREVPFHGWFSNSEMYCRIVPILSTNLQMDEITFVRPICAQERRATNTSSLVPAVSRFAEPRAVEELEFPAQTRPPLPSECAGCA